MPARTRNPTTPRTPLRMPPLTPAQERTMRGWNKTLGTWHVCDNDSCRRGRACRGNLSLCTPKNFRRLPRGAQAWFAALLLSKEEGLTFDAAIARIEATPIAEAYAAWQASLPGA